MLATAIIVFREILEASLIIGIVAAATRGVSRRNWWIGGGVSAGVIGAVIVALLADVIMNLAEGVGQEIFNAAILLAAVMMLAWHNIWMASHSRELVVQMKQVGHAVKEGGQPMYALAFVVAVAVLREGSEVVLFLYGQYAGGEGSSAMLSGGAVGLAIGIAVGFALYAGLLRIPTRYLFAVTGWMILLLAAGMASQAAKFLAQADILPGWGTAWDSSAILSNDSLAGKLLHTLIGYDERPGGIQLVAYLFTLLTIGVAMKLVNQRETVPSSPASWSNAGALAAIVIGALFALGAAKSHASPASYVYMPNVEYGETEVEFNGGVAGNGGPSDDAAQQWTAAIGRGLTPYWFSEVELSWARDEGGSSSHYQLSEWVNIFQLTERGQYWADLSLFTEFEMQNHNTTDADTFEIGPMFQKEFAATVNNLNLVFVNQYGSNADHHADMEYAWQTRVKGDPKLEYGFQAMGAFGHWNDMTRIDQQEHKIGPALFGEAKTGADKIKYNAALLFGATNSSNDYTLRFSVEYEFR